MNKIKDNRIAMIRIYLEELNEEQVGQVIIMLGEKFPELGVLAKENIQ